MFSFPKPDNWLALKQCEQIQYYKHHLNEHYAPYVDKLEAKAIVAATGLAVPRTVRVLYSPDDVRSSDLNPCYILKTTHASGWNLFINKRTKLEDLRRAILKWNRHYTGVDEPHYKYVKPGFFLEERLDDPLYGADYPLTTYRLRCLYGKPLLISVRDFKHNTLNHYDLEWNLIQPQTFEFTPPSVELTQQMIHYASRLSAPFEFVRIDFYISGGVLYFSEYTFTPNSGEQHFDDVLEYKLGAMWSCTNGKI